MVKSILDKIVKPGDSILAFGIPTSIDDFIKDIENGNKDFAKTVAGGWFQYKAKIMSILRETEPILEDLGVTIIHQLTLDDFGKLFKENRAKVIILFTHWKEKSPHPHVVRWDNPDSCASRVEFYDGLKGLHEIIQQIPTDFHNVLDLNVCRCKDLAEALKQTRPNCYFRHKVDVFGTGKGDYVKLDIMLHFYKILFKHLNRTDLAYFHAYKDVLNKFSGLLTDLVRRQP